MAIGYLKGALGDGTLIHNFEFRSNPREIYREIDIALLTPLGVWLVDVKHVTGKVVVDYGKWVTERYTYPSPVKKIRMHARALASMLASRLPAARSIYVGGAVLMTSPTFSLVDPLGQEAPSVVRMEGAVEFFQAASNVPDPFARGRLAIEPHLPTIEALICGEARPPGPRIYGLWGVVEELGGDETCAEYRAKHTTVSADIARLRVYRADPYKPDPERQHETTILSRHYVAVRKLRHENILWVREFFPTPDEDAFVLVTDDPGWRLLSRVQAESPLSVGGSIRIIKGVLAGLSHAHGQGVLHRNLTPNSILVDDSGGPLLTDFECARVIGGTTTIADAIVDDIDLRYQAPECRGDPSRATERSDLFSAGAVFYEVLTRRCPFGSVQEMDRRYCVFPQRPSEANPALPAGIDTWLQALCSLDPLARPESAGAALIGLEALGVAAATGPGTMLSATTPRHAYEDLEPGSFVDSRFTVIERCGQAGGFASAYVVRDAHVDTTRVLKLVNRDHLSNLDRLRRENKALEQVGSHPHVVWPRGTGDLKDGTYYLLLEHCDGPTVRELMQRGEAAPLTEVARQGADALAHIHSRGVFHRDIKPENLIWTAAGLKIIDFNVALLREDIASPSREHRTGETRRYMPPDFDRAAPPTEQTLIDCDLFALGVTLYELASGGQYPWDSPRPMSMAPRPLGLSSKDARLEPVILKAIDPLRFGRFSDATAFAHAVDTAIAAPSRTAAFSGGTGDAAAPAALAREDQGQAPRPGARADSPPSPIRKPTTPGDTARGVSGGAAQALSSDGTVATDRSARAPSQRPREGGTPGIPGARMKKVKGFRPTGEHCSACGAVLVPKAGVFRRAGTAGPFYCSSCALQSGKGRAGAASTRDPAPMKVETAPEASPVGVAEGPGRPFRNAPRPLAGRWMVMRSEVEQFFDSLPRHFVPERAGDWQASVFFDIATAPHHVRIRDGQCQVLKGPPTGPPSCVLACTVDDFAGLLMGAPRRVRVVETGALLRFFACMLRPMEVYDRRGDLATIRLIKAGSPAAISGQAGQGGGSQGAAPDQPAAAPEEATGPGTLPARFVVSDAREGDGGPAYRLSEGRLRRASIDGVYLYETPMGAAIEMVGVPAGPFVTGTTNPRGWEQAIRTQTMPHAFYVGRYPVKRREYARFCRVRKWPLLDTSIAADNDCPIVNVSFDSALAFCEFNGLDLPTEAEWEKAARGVDGRRYPWGHEKPTPDRAVWAGHPTYGLRGPAPATGRLPGASPWGAIDMAGNVWEWCSGWVEEGVTRPVRGGSWLSGGDEIGTVARDRVAPHLCRPTVGFRPVLRCPPESRAGRGHD